MPKLLEILSTNPASKTHPTKTPPPAYTEKEQQSAPASAYPPMSSTRTPKPVGGQMSEGVGVSRVKPPKPKESKMEKFKRYVSEDAEKQARGDIWGGRRGMGGHG